MKIKLLLLVFFIYSNIAFANKIDSLASTQEVVDFLKTVNEDFADNQYQEFKILPTAQIAAELDCDGIFKQWDIKNWEKADLNNDGLTDLLILPHWYSYDPYAIIDEGNGGFKLHRLFLNVFEECELAKPIQVNGQTQLMIYKRQQQRVTLGNNEWKFNTVQFLDTLSFKFNDLVELNNNPADYQIKSIFFKTSSCLGTCPIFTLKMDSKGKTVFDGIAYTNFPGKSSKNLPVALFNELHEILNYISVKQLEEHYEVNWTDDQTATLTIVFANKESKTIRDYGMQGTYGLRTVYTKLMDIGMNTRWK